MTWDAWRSWSVGVRVVVRRRLPGGGFSDALGELLTVGPEGVRVATRRGEIEVPASEIVIGKLVPPPPPRRAPRHPPGAGAPIGRDEGPGEQNRGEGPGV